MESFPDERKLYFMAERALPLAWSLRGLSPADEIATMRMRIYRAPVPPSLRWASRRPGRLRPHRSAIAVQTFDMKCRLILVREGDRDVISMYRVGTPDAWSGVRPLSPARTVALCHPSSLHGSTLLTLYAGERRFLHRPGAALAPLCYQSSGVENTAKRYRLSRPGCRALQARLADVRRACRNTRQQRLHMHYTLTLAEASTRACSAAPPALQP